MKKALSLLALIIFTATLLQAQDTLYIYKNGATVYERAVADIDTITFYNPNLLQQDSLYIYKNGATVYQRAVADIDSIIFYKPASSNFKLAGDSFKFNFKTSKFLNAATTANSNNWFNASFNERVNWQIKITTKHSKAYKIITGTSNVLDQSTSLWTGTQSGLYFFINGDTAIAELSVNGSNQRWYDTTTIISVKGKKDYSTNALIWYDMENMAVSGLNWYYYFDAGYYSGVDTVVQWGDIALSDLKDPVQGRYRSMLAKSTSANSFWVGGFGANDISPANVSTGNYGFPGASLNEVYLNFYIRRKTTTTPSMGIWVKSQSDKAFVSRKFNTLANRWDTLWTYTYTSIYGNVAWAAGVSGIVWTVPGGRAEEWNLVSVRLDQMIPEAGKPPFDPSKIVSISGALGTAPLTGFDMDFVVFTRGVPFNELLDQIK